MFFLLPGLALQDFEFLVLNTLNPTPSTPSPHPQSPQSNSVWAEGEATCKERLLGKQATPISIYLVPFMWQLRVLYIQYLGL